MREWEIKHRSVPPWARVGVILLALLLALAPGVVAEEGKASSLPTPYSAEQIRDAWPLGFEQVTEITSQGRVFRSTTTVTEWSAEGMTTRDAVHDTEGQAMGEPKESIATWAAVRDHALFPSDMASRQREQRSTALGELEGWLYTVRHEDGAVSEFYFADAYPGPPVVFGKTQAGNPVFRAEVIERRLPGEEAKPGE